MVLGVGLCVVGRTREFAPTAFSVCIAKLQPLPVAIFSIGVKKNKNEKAIDLVTLFSSILFSLLLCGFVCLVRDLFLNTKEF